MKGASISASNIPVTTADRLSTESYFLKNIAENKNSVTTAETTDVKITSRG